MTKRIAAERSGPVLRMLEDLFARAAKFLNALNVSASTCRRNARFRTKSAVVADDGDPAGRFRDRHSPALEPATARPASTRI